ncbi:MAG TPA: cytochrome b/b6 domain-containing protein [Candidatus Dormibacteraeota bacterium]|nr:cytochrome b/b6 domain-containing protein [Candidatus Dormibacteraeota bacterium]
MPRFSVNERVVHWLFAAAIFALLISGLGLWLPPAANPVLDHRDAVRTVHLDASLALLAIVIPALGRGAPINRLWHDVEFFTRGDWLWLRRIVIPKRWRRRPLPPQGRFNAGQKLNSVATAAATVGFVITGTVMWQGERLSPSLALASDTWHIWLMWLIVPLIAGHMVLALVLPSTRPALRGIVFGNVRLDFARRRHGAWAPAAEPEPEPDSATPESPTDGTAA